MSTLDRDSPMPLWAQLADDLRRRAATGDFDTGLPSENELVVGYGVSRNTVREALRRLRDERLIDRQRGRGTILVDVELEQTSPGRYSLARNIEGQGLEEHSTVVALDLQAAGESSGPLGIADSAEVVFVERVRFAGDEPLALDRSWLPADLAQPLLDADLTQGSLYDALRDLCDVRVTGGSDRITPVIPAPDDRAKLRQAPNAAAFSVERLARSIDRVVEWRMSLVRGDRYRLVSTWP